MLEAFGSELIRTCFTTKENQVTPFTLKTSDGESIYAWHILPLKLYGEHLEGLTGYHQPSTGIFLKKLKVCGLGDVFAEAGWLSSESFEVLPVQFQWEDMPSVYGFAVARFQGKWGDLVLS